MAIELTVVTPEGQAFAGPVEEVVLPGSEGRFGVLERHERFLAPLEPGLMEIRTGSGSEWRAVSDGFADVSGERVVVLVDSVRTAKDVDVEAAEEAKRQAEEALAAMGVGDVEDIERIELQHDLARAEAQLEVREKG